MCYLLPLLALFQRHCPHCIRFFDEFIHCLVQCCVLQILRQRVCTPSASKLEVKPRALGCSTSFLHTLRSLRWVHTLEPIFLYSYVCHLCQNGYWIHYVWAHSGRLDWLGLGGPGCCGWGAVVGQSRDTLPSIWHYPLFHKCHKKISKYKKQAKPTNLFFLYCIAY